MKPHLIPPLNPKPRLRRQLRRPREKRFRKPVLRFTPTAWSKLRFLRDLGPTEVGGFGIAAADDLLCVEDVRLVKQSCTEITVKFDDHGVADFFDEQIDAGRRPEQVGRLWLHTHPGDCPLPSGIDVETFAGCFGRCDWAVMFILARNDACYAELRWSQAGECRLPMQVRIDYSRPFPASDFEAWEAEYHQHVIHERDVWPGPAGEWDGLLEEEFSIASEDLVEAPF